MVADTNICTVLLLLLIFGQNMRAGRHFVCARGQTYFRTGSLPSHTHGLSPTPSHSLLYTHIDTHTALLSPPRPEEKHADTNAALITGAQNSQHARSPFNRLNQPTHFN